MSFLQDLLSLPVPTCPQLSPDGQKIVYSTSLPYGHKTGDHFRSTLWLAETGERSSARPLTSGEFNDREPRWCDDGKGIVFLSDRGKVGESCTVYRLAIEGGEVWPVTEEGNSRGIDRVEVLPGSSSRNGGRGGRGKVVYLSADERSEEVKAREREKDDARVWGEEWAYNRLRMVDLDSRESVTLVSKEMHLIDLACSEAGSKIAVSYVRNPDLEAKYLYGTTVAVYDLETKEWTEICHFATYITDLTWVGSDLYFIGPADETTAASSQMVFRIDLSTGVKRTGYTKQAYGEVNCAMKLKRLGTALAVGMQDGMADEIHILEGRRERSRTLLTQNQTLDAWDAIVRPDSDEVILAVSTSSPSHPAEIYTTTVSSSSSELRVPITPLSTHGQYLLTTYPNQLTAVHCKLLTCPSTDSTVQLTAALFLPTRQPRTTPPQSPFPTLVTLHGGPYYRFTSHFAHLTPHSIFTSLLLSAGYALLLPNYRGSSGRGRAFAEFGKNGGSGREGYEDVIAMTAYAIGAGVMVMVVMVVVVLGQRRGEEEEEEEEEEGEGGDSGSRSPGRGETSAIWEVHEAVEKGVKIPPMLILRGEKDERVPLEQGVGMRRALEGTGTPCEFVVYPREGHFIQERRHLVDIAERSLRFVEKYIGGNRAEESM
ncbi:hypothetical protein D0864_08597 [Hortaea werneckii]|uniref:Dipeptidyl-peptidase V n=1 Tax=Hortaea werneckii TaxID=91943 RepID=A0A3M7EVQ1_HORWE|nr:hypothetical protein D0864_08597 [Hortaea werneckii]